MNFGLVGLGFFLVGYQGVAGKGIDGWLWSFGGSFFFLFQGLLFTFYFHLLDMTSAIN